MPEPRMTPQELVSDALDAIAADANEEIVAALSRAKSISNSSRIPRHSKP